MTDHDENNKVTPLGPQQSEDGAGDVGIPTDEDFEDMLNDLQGIGDANLDDAKPQVNHRTIKQSPNVQPTIAPSDGDMSGSMDDIMSELFTPATPEEVKKQLRDRGISLRAFNPGRLPLYYRAEVERIKADPRPHSIMAEVEGVSLTTIMKVRSAGKFEGVEYIARDEIDRQAQREGFQPTMKEALSNTRSEQLKRGRPFKSRRRMTDEERRAIAYHPQEAHIVAEKYGVSVAYVYRMRREYGVRYINRDPLTPSQREKFDAFKDKKSVTELAGILNLPPLVITALLDEYKTEGIIAPHDVTPEVTADSSGDDDAVE